VEAGFGDVVGDILFIVYFCFALGVFLPFADPFGLGRGRGIVLIVEFALQYFLVYFDLGLFSQDLSGSSERGGFLF
jgi:hypothetical protein